MIVNRRCFGEKKKKKHAFFAIFALFSKKKKMYLWRMKKISLICMGCCAISRDSLVAGLFECLEASNYSANH